MTSQSKRTRKVLIGAASLGVANVASSFVWLIIIGMAARSFKPEEFGLWSILISLSGLFITGFDLGFGNALRNKLAAANSQPGAGQAENQLYFFSVFYWLIFLAAGLGVLFFLAKPFIPWALLFKAHDLHLVTDGAWLFTIGAVLCLFNTAFTLYSFGFFSYHESHWNALLGFFSKLALLIALWLLIAVHQSFFSISLMFFVITLLSSAVSLCVFAGVRKWTFIHIELSSLLARVKELWRKSAQFAMLQVFATILLYADLFVISNMLGLASVGDYFLVKRIYLLVAGFQFTFLLPVWSAYTESMECGDYSWTKSVLKKTALYTVLMSIAGVIFVWLFGNYIVTLWAGKHVQNASLFIYLGVWLLLYNWNNCFSVFLNAVNRLKIQVLLIALGMLAFIPLALYLGRIYSTPGVCIALIIVHIPLFISNPIESVSVLRRLQKTGQKPAPAIPTEIEN